MPTLSANQIAGYAKNAGVTGQNIAIATAIALAESGGQTDVVSKPNRNGTVDRGVWQINSVHSDLAGDPLNPSDNAAMMFTLSHGGTNWHAWSTYNSGAYLAHLSTAQAATPDTSVSAQTVSVNPDAFTAVQNFAKLISDPRTWQRLGMVVGGSVMILVAVHKTVPVPVPGIAKLAAKVVV